MIYDARSGTRDAVETRDKVMLSLRVGLLARDLTERVLCLPSVITSCSPGVRADTCSVAVFRWVPLSPGVALNSTHLNLPQ